MNAEIHLPYDEVIVIMQTNFPADYAGPQGLAAIIARNKSDRKFKIRIKLPSGRAISAISPPHLTEIPEVVKMIEETLNLYRSCFDDENLPPLYIEHFYPPNGAKPDEYLTWMEDNDLLGRVESHPIN